MASLSHRVQVEKPCLKIQNPNKVTGNRNQGQWCPCHLRGKLRQEDQKGKASLVYTTSQGVLRDPSLLSPHMPP